ncbi:TPA: antiterminator Q family protein [Escherichia coli]|uniref:antiterminator Q family protein n=2 Tax=Escherichia coli TaxID=562 RepID=UPI002556D4AD|nr:antiterminator Q family protein [Escherichia coli]
MRDIQMVLERWGAWAASGNTGVDYSPIAAGFKGLLPSATKPRPACCDDDGLIIENCLARLKQKKPEEYSLLIAHYLLRISKRQIARTRKKSEKAIRIEMQIPVIKTLQVMLRPPRNFRQPERLTVCHLMVVQISH